MQNYIRENINKVQTLAKEKISLLLEGYGYCLIKDEHNTKGIETRILQWSNKKKNHTVQLIWDSKEQWFDLGDFNTAENLNYVSARTINIIPIRVSKWFNRKQYINGIIDSMINDLNAQLNSTLH